MRDTVFHRQALHALHAYDFSVRAIEGELVCPHSSCYGRHVMKARNATAKDRSVWSIVCSASLVVMFFLPGCAHIEARVPAVVKSNPDYVDYTCGKDLSKSPYVAFNMGMPDIREGEYLDDDLVALSGRGYLLVAEASWDDPEYDINRVLPTLKSFGPSILLVYHLDGGVWRFYVPASVMVPPVTDAVACSYPVGSALPRLSEVVPYSTRRHVVLAWVPMKASGIWGLGGDRAGVRMLEGSGYDAGLAVSRVIVGTPADEAGVRLGDIVVEVDGNRNPTIELLTELRKKAFPQGMPLRIWRSGSLIDVRLRSLL